MYGYHNLNLEQIKVFLLAGRARFIIINKNNNKHITFEVRRKEPYMYHVYYKSQKREYIGTIITTDTSITYYSLNETKTHTEIQMINSIVFGKLVQFLYVNNIIPTNIDIMYVGECGVCGRMLTDPESISIGIGKICKTKL